MKNLLKYWSGLTPLTQKIFLFTLINIILINLGLIVMFFTSFDDTIGYHIKLFLLFKQDHADSWRPMKHAFDYVHFEHHKPLYDEIFFDKKIKFQYPPTSLLIFYPVNIIYNFLKNTGISFFGVLKELSWLFVVVMIYFVIQIFNLSFTSNVEPSKNYGSQVDLVTRNTLIFCLALTFYPVIRAYSLGQIQAWINSLFAILFWCWMKEKKVISGVIAGTMCLIKPQYVIILLWGVLRKQLSFTLAMFTTVITGISVAILVFGIADNINYLSVLSFISKHGEAFYPNQSINGLLNRLLFNGDNLNFDSHSFPPFNPYVYAGTTISSIALISLALFPPKKANGQGSVTDLAIVGLTCTIASPVAWEHHYGVLIPIYAFLLPCLLKKKIFGRITIPYLCISYLLASNYFAVTQKLAYAKFNLNIIQSYLLFAGLMVLICLYLLRSAKINSEDNAQADNRPC